MPRKKGTKNNRTEKWWNRLEKSLYKETHEYPRFREEYKNAKSTITIRCLKHDCTYKAKYGVHTNKQNSTSKCCPICKQELQFNSRFLPSLEKVNPIYKVSFEDWLEGGKSCTKSHRNIKVFCTIHNTFFTTNANQILCGKKSCPRCKKDHWEAPRITRTPEMIEKLIRLAEEGYGYVTISRELGIGESTAKRIYEDELKLGELPRDKKYRERGEKWRKILNEYTSKGYSVKEISDITGEPYDPLLSFAIRNNIPHITFKIPEWRKILTLEEAERQIIKNRELVTDLARDYGVEDYRIRWHLDKIGFVNISDLNLEFRTQLASEVKELCDLGWNWRDIQEELELSPYLLNKLSEEFNFELNKDILYYKGEKNIEDYLISNNFKYDSQVRNLDIVGRSNNSSSRGVIIDFVVTLSDGREVYIEHHGDQHFRYENFFHRHDYNNFIYQVQRDINIRKYCKDNNIILIEIPQIKYKSLEDITDLLDKILKDGVSPEELINIDSFYKNGTPEELINSVIP